MRGVSYHEFANDATANEQPIGATASAARHRLQPRERAQDQRLAVEVEERRVSPCSRRMSSHRAAQAGSRASGISRSASAIFGRRAPPVARGAHQPRQHVEQQVEERLEALLVGGEGELIGQRVHRRPIDLRQRRQQTPRCARTARARRCPRVAGPGARCPRPAARAAPTRWRPGISMSAAASAAVAAPLQRLRRQRRQVQPAAARADGGQQAARLRRRPAGTARASAAPPATSAARWRR